MQFEVECRSANLKGIVDHIVRILIKELRLQSSRKTLTIKTQRGLARNDGMRGVVGPHPLNPDQLVMLIDSQLKDQDLVETICHEMVHVKQFALGQAQIRYRGEKATFYWLGKKVKASYWDQPWEHDAWRREKVLASRIYRIIDKR